MKIRNGFVTNSSSSSFILAFKDKNDGFKKISSLISEYGAESVGVLLKDFDEASPIPYEKIYDEVCDEMKYSAQYEARRKILYNNDMKYDAEDEETAIEKETWRIMDDIYRAFLKKIKNRPYLVRVEYDSHDPVRRRLEDGLFKHKFTVAYFDHH